MFGPKHDEPRMNIRVRAILLVRDHLKLPDRGHGLKYRGVCGVDHMVTDARGRWFAVDLVLKKVTMCVGAVPRPQPW